MFYAVFFVFYNVALGYTTVARGTLALSTLPVMTMLAGAAARHRGADRQKDHGRAGGDAGRGRGAGLGAGARAGRRLARRPDHGGRDLVHGALQRVLAPLHRPLQRPGVPDMGHGRRRRRSGRGQSALRRAVANRQVRAPARPSPRSTLPPAAVRSPSSCGCLPCSAPAPPASPTPWRSTRWWPGSWPRSCSTSRSPLNLAVGLAAVFAGIWIATTDGTRAAALTRTPKA